MSRDQKDNWIHLTNSRYDANSYEIDASGGIAVQHFGRIPQSPRLTRVRGRRVDVVHRQGMLQRGPERLNLGIDDYWGVRVIVEQPPIAVEAGRRVIEQRSQLALRGVDYLQHGRVAREDEQGSHRLSSLSLRRLVAGDTVTRSHDSRRSRSPH